MLLEDLMVEADEFTARTGWALKPEGACKGEVCVPLPEAVHTRAGDGRVDVRELAPRLGMPLVRDDRAGLWALGPETGVTGRALTSAIAPDLTLRDASGEPFHLSTLRGQKVVMVAWASW